MRRLHFVVSLAGQRELIPTSTGALSALPFITREHERFLGKYLARSLSFR
jgi:hypothetical protein